MRVIILQVLMVANLYAGSLLGDLQIYNDEGKGLNPAHAVIVFHHQSSSNIERKEQSYEWKLGREMQPWLMVIRPGEKIRFQLGGAQGRARLRVHGKGLSYRFNRHQRFVERNFHKVGSYRVDSEDLPGRLGELHVLDFDRAVRAQESGFFSLENLHHGPWLIQVFYPEWSEPRMFEVVVSEHKTTAVKLKVDLSVDER